uniref:Clone ZZD1332 mRNA sequence n=1 Tax=Schistosoma japonicum TaxID=6182 RepID=Q86EX3_SCHJA|nr:hypothetical protein [Schistosoma japonicum]
MPKAPGVHADNKIVLDDELLLLLSLSLFSSMVEYSGNILFEFFSSQISLLSFVIGKPAILIHPDPDKTTSTLDSFKFGTVSIGSKLSIALVVVNHKVRQYSYYHLKNHYYFLA